MKKCLKGNKQAIIFILAGFLIWRLLLFGLAFLGIKIFPFSHFFPYLEFFLSPHGNPLFWTWANFDGVYYLTIAESGYTAQYTQVLFPVYPLFIRYLGNIVLGRDYLLAGLLISNAFFIVSLYFFYKLVKLDFEERICRWAIIFLLLFPTSFFFGAVYSESLFLAFVLGSFYAARCGKWWLAGILGALATGTRAVGIFLFPALLVEWWMQKSVNSDQWSVTRKKKPITNHQLRSNKLCLSLITLIPIFLIPLGLLYYMRFLQINFHDPLMFLHVQPAFGAQRAVDKVILLYQVFWRYFKMIATTKWDPLYFTVWLEFLTGAGFLGLLISAYLKKIRFSYLIFAFFAYITPTLTGTFSSMPRYVLILFPCFIALALIENKYFRFLFLVSCFLFLVVSTIFFTRGYWIG